MKKHLLFAFCILCLLLSCTLFGCEETLACGHGNVAIAASLPTCDVAGYTQKTCQVCGYSYQTDFVPPKGHELTETTTPATCLEPGYTDYRCDCGYSYRINNTPPAQHSYELTRYTPTCEGEGYDEYRCLACTHSYRTNTVSALGHTLTEEVHPANCTTEGYTEFHCSACELVYRTNLTDALGHSLTPVHCIHPTLTEHGVLKQVCSSCQTSFTNYLMYCDLFPGAYVSNREILAQGIDVSMYQHRSDAAGNWLPLDWAAIKAQGVDFAILKAGSTASGKDPVFEMNYTDAKAAGIDLGVYFYTYAQTLDQVSADLTNLLSWLEGKQLEYPVYFDLEDPSLENLGIDLLTEMCTLFINTMRNNGYYGALYSNNNWLTNHLDGDAMKEYCDIWYARYPHNNPTSLDEAFAWNPDRYGSQLGLWQYSQQGRLAECGMPPEQAVDLNYAYKDYPALMRTYGFNGYTFSES